MDTTYEDQLDPELLAYIAQRRAEERARRFIGDNDEDIDRDISDLMGEEVADTYVTNGETPEDDPAQVDWAEDDDDATARHAFLHDDGTGIIDPSAERPTATSTGARTAHATRA